RERFYNARMFNQELNDWNVSSVTNMRAMFRFPSPFNQDIGAWDVSSVTIMSDMFNHSQVFNQDIGVWDVSSVTEMNSMFDGARVFDQDLSQWDVSSVTDMSKMFAFVRLSIANYDAILINWSKLDLQMDVTFSGGHSRFSSAAIAARDTLTGSTFNWTISDYGLQID
ncbi:MAG: DUF285 domain-containing protein, partial [Saccharospirillaceae bacterium]|nr:BspA family leucine-rich repeat surface protein [Pseudomonadales bacterium]NRB81768.1 DUF285 domain-containing protein [Saccharospirillaceae bacterium]